MSTAQSRIENRKDAMLEKAEARMKQIDAEVDRLKAKAQEADADRKLELERQLSDLMGKRETFKSRVQDLKNAGEDALSDLSDGFEQAWTTLSDALDSAKTRFQ